MAEWEIHGVAFGSCNCNWSCPCQFNAPTTHGSCEGVLTGRIDRGHFDGVSLDGLAWAMVFQWPGEIAEGNGRQQTVINETARVEMGTASSRVTGDIKIELSNTSGQWNELHLNQDGVIR
jgi:hypothetical protein